MNRDPDQVQWFGENWGAPVCEETEHIETPVGVPCILCEKPIAAGDHGIAMIGGGHPPGNYIPGTKRMPAHLACITGPSGLGPPAPGDPPAASPDYYKAPRTKLM